MELCSVERRGSGHKAEGLIDYRQGVEQSETPVKSATINQNPDGVTEFCRTFGTYILLASIAGVSCCALHTLPVFLTPLRGFGGGILCISSSATVSFPVFGVPIYN